MLFIARAISLSPVVASYSDLLLHNDVCWLSRGDALEKFISQENETCFFLEEEKEQRSRTAAQKCLTLMTDPTFMENA